MAAIGAEEFYIIDIWPGAPDANLSEPTVGFDSTTISNVATAVYTPGSKIMGYNELTVSADGARSMNQGTYTMMYAKYHCSTTLADITACDLLTISCLSGDVHGPLAVTRETTAGSSFGPLAVCILDMTPDSFGWFWCGGQCPQNDVTSLDTSIYVTDGSVVGGFPIALSGASVCTLKQYEITSLSADAAPMVGMALISDA